MSVLVSFVARLTISVALKLHYHRLYLLGFTVTHCFLESHLMNAGKEATTDHDDILDCLIYNSLYAKSKFLADSYLFCTLFSYYIFPFFFWLCSLAKKNVKLNLG